MLNMNHKLFLKIITVLILSCGLITSAFAAKYSELIKTLLASADESAYKLSVPLLISAQSRLKDQYNFILQDEGMEQAVAKLTDPSFKAWMLGRMLLAAHSINDKSRMSAIHKQLQLLLKNDSTPQNEFTAWAWGYLAGYSKSDYNRHRNNMLAAASKLSEQYSSTSKPEALSNALWAWVMSLRAAAYAGDKTTYAQIKAEIIKLNNQATVEQALTTGLLRNQTSNDYPAWALGITRLAAAKIGDKKLYRALETPLHKSILNASADDAALAQLNDFLAQRAR